MSLSLGYPSRPHKPRRNGRTALIDPGLPLGLFADTLNTHHPYIDAVKFGWTTGLFTAMLPAKIEIASRLQIDCWVGGTAFEMAWQEGKLDDYIAWLRQLGLTRIEISDGTVSLAANERERLIRDLRGAFCIIAEVGKKARQIEPDAAAWIALARADLAAGAELVIFEGRESGTAGVYGSEGEVRSDLLGAILSAGLPRDRLAFEAPRKDQQAWFLRRLGPEVNLSNIAWSDVISLETLRRGLRSDTAGRLPSAIHPTQRAS
jgi:phosphosulfolactate synthase